MMKKIIILILCLSVYAPVMADDYADSLTEIASIVRQNLNVWGSSAKLPDSVVFNSVREGFISLAPILYAREFTDTVYTDTGQFQYAIDSQFLVVDMIFYKSGFNMLTVPLIDADSFNIIYSTPMILKAGEENQSIPTYCNWRGTYLRFYPVPIKVDTFIVSGFAKVVDLMSDTTFVADFPVTYRPAVIAYATAHAALKSRNPAWKEWLELYGMLKNDLLYHVGKGSDEK